MYHCSAELSVQYDGQSQSQSEHASLNFFAYPILRAALFSAASPAERLRSAGSLAMSLTNLILKLVIQKNFYTETLEVSKANLTPYICITFKTNNLTHKCCFCHRTVFCFHIDLFHEWRQIINYFASIKISLTSLILKLVIQKNFFT